jgi:hypothetical protein
MDMSKSKKNAKPAPWSVRQGDVLIVRLEGDVASGKPVKRDGGRVVLAYGEVTGHAHAIRERGADLFELAEDKGKDGDDAWARAARILRVSAKAGVELRHEEHATIHLPPGNYHVTRQREYQPGELRLVAD